MSLHVSDDDSFCQALAVSLVPSVVLNLNVQVQRAFTAVDLLAVLVGADVLPVNLLSCTPIVLLTCRIFAIPAVDHIRLSHRLLAGK